MPDSTLISKTELTPNMLKIKYNVPNVAAAGTGSEYTLNIDPFTIGSMNDFYIVNASTTYTVSLSDVAGGTNTPAVDEILRVEDINKNYNENGLGIIFHNTSSYLYLKITNEDTVATGISTISVIIRR